MSRQRVIKEVTDILRLCNSGSIWRLDTKDDDDMYTWDLLMKATDDCAYRGGIFRIRMMIPGTYPSQPPYLRFITPILHPNVNLENGEVCIDILKEQWSPSLTLSIVLTSVITVLQEPNVLSPLNIDASNLLKLDKLGFDSLAQYATQEHACSEEWPDVQVAIGSLNSMKQRQ